MSTPQYTPKDIQRFWSKVDSSGGVDSCWNWTARRSTKGYGQFNFKGKVIRAHRMAYELVNDLSPGDLFVLHSCDNPTCCNPKHLFLGTHIDNMQDMISKGRGNKINGELHYNAKLTAAQVRTIRTRYASGGLTYKMLAAEMGVHETNIGAIIRGEKWKEV